MPEEKKEEETYQGCSQRPPGRSRITWLNTVQRDLRAYNFTLNEAVDLLTQNRLLVSTYGATHS